RGWLVREGVWGAHNATHISDRPRLAPRCPFPLRLTVFLLPAFLLWQGNWWQPRPGPRPALTTGEKGSEVLRAHSLSSPQQSSELRQLPQVEVRRRPPVHPLASP